MPKKASTSLSSLATLLPSKELLKLLEYIPKRLLAALLSMASLTELVLEALETTEASHATAEAAAT